MRVIWHPGVVLVSVCYYCACVDRYSMNVCLGLHLVASAVGILVQPKIELLRPCTRTTASLALSCAMGISVEHMRAQFSGAMGMQPATFWFPVDSCKPTSGCRSTTMCRLEISDPQTLENSPSACSPQLQRSSRPHERVDIIMGIPLYPPVQLCAPWRHLIATPSRGLESEQASRHQS